jgi:hypothetical protein
VSPTEETAQSRNSGQPTPERQDRRADHETAHQDRGHGGEDAVRRHARLQQEGGEERAAAAERQGVDAIVQVEQVDGRVAEERHGGRPLGERNPARRRRRGRRTAKREGFSLPLGGFFRFSANGWR